MSPTEISRMSPGTISTALIFWTPSLSDLITLPVSGSYSFKASIADSAFLSCEREISVRKQRLVSASYLPDSNTGVGDQNEQNHKRFYECSDGIIIFKESQNLREKYYIWRESKKILFSYERDDGGQQQDFDQKIIKLF